jgi:sulfur relay (sulfurtransferase) complex TusBCD TusD component (DsrE family)
MLITLLCDSPSQLRHVSVNTVTNPRQKILEKLRAANTSEAIEGAELRTMKELTQLTMESDRMIKF